MSSWRQLPMGQMSDSPCSKVSQLIKAGTETKWPTFRRRHFSNVFSWMKINEIWLKISVKCVPKGSIDNIPALVQTMAWRRPGDKPLSEPMTISLLSLNELRQALRQTPNSVKNQHGLKFWRNTSQMLKANWTVFLFCRRSGEKHKALNSFLFSEIKMLNTNASWCFDKLNIKH